MIKFKRRVVQPGVWKVEKTEGDHRIRCDECGAKEYSDGLEWDEWWPDLKDAGWKARKDDDDAWTHFCPACEVSFDTGALRFDKDAREKSIRRAEGSDNHARAKNLQLSGALKVSASDECLCQCWHCNEVQLRKVGLAGRADEITCKRCGGSVEVLKFY